MKACVCCGPCNPSNEDDLRSGGLLFCVSKGISIRTELNLETIVIEIGITCFILVHAQPKPEPSVLPPDGGTLAMPVGR